MDIKHLLTRVRAATGPDREFDAELVEVFGTKGPNGLPFCANVLGIAPFTASIDYALALVDQELPGCAVRIQRNIGGETWAELQRRKGEFYDVCHEGGNRANLPLAIIAALLYALADQKTETP